MIASRSDPRYKTKVIQVAPANPSTKSHFLIIIIRHPQQPLKLGQVVGYFGVIPKCNKIVVSVRNPRNPACKLFVSDSRKRSISEVMLRFRGQEFTVILTLSACGPRPCSLTERDFIRSLPGEQTPKIPVLSPCCHSSVHFMNGSARRLGCSLCERLYRSDPRPAGGSPMRTTNRAHLVRSAVKIFATDSRLTH